MMGVGETVWVVLWTLGVIADIVLIRYLTTDENPDDAIIIGLFWLGAIVFTVGLVAACPFWYL